LTYSIGLKGACKGKQYDIVKYVLSNYVKYFNIPDNVLLYIAWNTACHYGDIKIVDFLNHHDLFNSTDFENATRGSGKSKLQNGLIGAIQTNNVEIVKYMREYGVNIDLLHINSIISIACQGGNLDLLNELLKQHKTFIFTENHFEMACVHANPDVIKLIFENWRKNDFDVTKLILNNGLDSAARCGNLEVVNFLILHGANNFNNTILCYHDDEKINKLDKYMEIITPSCYTDLNVILTLILHGGTNYDKLEEDDVFWLLHNNYDAEKFDLTKYGLFVARFYELKNIINEFLIKDLVDICLAYLYAKEI